MLDWIFEGIVKWISSIVSQLMDAVSGLFLNTLNTDLTAMEEYFPFVTKAFDVMQYMAWAILFLITVWQLFRVFGGPITEAENPLTLLARSSLFALLIGYAKPIFLIALDIARAPYTALMDVAMTSEDFTFAGIEQSLSNGLTTFIAITSVVGLLLLIILEISLGWNYFKLLLETVERYIVVGVLCYTSPLAYAMGASKSTVNVFKAWCRMVGSQLLLLVLNVWFLRAFNSSMGQFMGNGGALSTGGGSIFLWMFCALAFLKTAQKFDSYLASMGLNVAQTGSGMGMEMLMAARVISGLGGGAKSAGSVFRGTASAAGGNAAGGFMSGFANMFKGNSYVRDAVVNGGTRMGAGGSLGFVGRAFGGMAARNGAVLNADSISSVASKAPNVSGTIGGEIANRSLGNYMPQLGGYKLSDTQITGGQISTKAESSDGKISDVELFSASQFEKPDAPHSVAKAADGSEWYQMASGDGSGAFYSVPEFTGDVSEAGMVKENFPGAEDGTVLRTADDGVLEATIPGNSSALYSSDVYNQPDGTFSVVTDENGNEWYQIQSADIESGIASVPSEKDAYSFSDMPDDTAFSYAGNGVVEASSEDGGSSLLYSGEFYNEPDAPHSVVTDDAGNTWYQMSADDIADGVQVPSFNGNAFGFSDMPDDTSYSFGGNGIIEASSADGDSVLYNSACFAEPEGSYQTVTDADGNSWYQMSAEAIGDGSISAPPFIGNESESYNPTFGNLSPSSENVSFPSMAEETVLTSAGNGVVMANEASDSNTLWYNSAVYDEPEAPHSTIQSSNGVSWYAMEPHASAPEFESGENAAAYNQAQFREFMPGYGQQITSVDGSKAAEGQFEVRHSDGGGTKFYDVTQYAAPKGDYQVFEDANGKQWYSIKGEPAVERKPVYENGKPVYEKDGKNVKTVSVDSVRYKTTPARFGKPGKRKSEIKAPKRKK